MNLSKNTLAILKNFSGISNSLRLRPGNTLTTCTESRATAARAVVEETFEHDTGIYDLSQFLGACSLLEEPDITFTADDIILKDKRKTIKMRAGSIKVVTGPSKFPLITDPIVSIPYTTDLHNKITKASGILSAPDFCLVGDGKEISVEVRNIKNDGASTFTQVVGETDKVFTAITKVDGLRLIQCDYEAFMCDNRMIVFRSQSMDLTYCIGVLPESTIEW